ASLKKSVSKFLSPNKTDNDDFKIIFSFYVNNKEIQKYEIMNDSFSYLKCKMNADLDSNGVCRIVINNNGVKCLDERIFIYPKGSPIGDVQSEIYYLDKGDKISFTKNMGIRTSDYGNIKVYRDSFRIMPYGEPHNDWLEIDKAHAQGAFRTFGTRDLVGNIFLSGKTITEKNIFKEATDRVGLIEDAKEFQELKNFEWVLIKKLEKFIFDQLKKDSQEATEVIKLETNEIKKETESTFDSFRKIVEETDIEPVRKKEILTNFDKTSIKFIDKLDNVERATEEIERKIKVYSQLSYKEGILYEMLHSIKNKLSVVDAQIRGFEYTISQTGIDIDTSILHNAYGDIQKLINGSLNKVNSSKLSKLNISLADVMKDVSDFQMDQLREKNINFAISDLNQFRNDYIRCVPESIKSVFENLFSNSIKALKYTLNPQIEIKIKESGLYYDIFFSDNGTGILEENKKNLFTLWSSSTNGTGIGLASARDIIEDHGGKINYVELEDDDYRTTFLIKLPRR
ncbi:TPA: ATP-binding protein, partial [Listeria monocytogenes]